jgi:hypothetical protein
VLAQHLALLSSKIVDGDVRVELCQSGDGDLSSRSTDILLSKEELGPEIRLGNGGRVVERDGLDTGKTDVLGWSVERARRRREAKEGKGRRRDPKGELVLLPLLAANEFDRGRLVTHQSRLPSLELR